MQDTLAQAADLPSGDGLSNHREAALRPSPALAVQVAKHRTAGAPADLEAYAADALTSRIGISDRGAACELPAAFLERAAAVKRPIVLRAKP